MSHLSNVWFKVTDLEVASGRGCRVTTVDGHEYLDFAAGIAVNSTGHCHPKVTAAIAAQAERFMHAQVNVFTHDLLEPLAAKLDAITPPGIDTFFFANSGAEITEAAVKLAKQATKRPNVIVFQGSFHGRTHLAMAMTTSKTVYRAGHSPLPGGVFVAPVPRPVGVRPGGHDQRLAQGLRPTAAHRRPHRPRRRASSSSRCSARAATSPPRRRSSRASSNGAASTASCSSPTRCRAASVARGNWFAIDHIGVEPDIICMAKGIASGFPFSALGTRRELDDQWPTGSHGGTYGGNPIGCAAALATIEVMSEPGFLDNVSARGDQLRDALSELKEHHPVLRQVRGPGLMVGASFEDPGRVPRVIEHCLREGRLILMNAGTYGNIIRWMPPLIVTAAEIDEAVGAFATALKATA